LHPFHRGINLELCTQKRGSFEQPQQRFAEKTGAFLMSYFSAYTTLSPAKKAGIIIAVLVLLYAIGGFLVAPAVLKSKAPAIIAEHLGRKATVEQVRLNPFALSLTLRDFELADADGERFIGFEELYINFQLSSIFRRALTFADISLTGPHGLVKVLPDGSLNVSDLLTTSTQSNPSQAQSRELPPVLVSQLQIERGRFTFKDLSLSTPYEETFFPIQLTLNNFDTRKDSQSPYSFTASTVAGAVINWEGDLSINPLGSQGRLAINKLDTPSLWKYIQDYVNFEVISGTVDLSGRYQVAKKGDAFDLEMTEGELQLGELIVAEKASKTRVISLPSLSVSGVEVDLKDKQVVVAAVASEGARGNGWLGPNGKFMYETVFSLAGLEERFGQLSRSSDEPQVDVEPWTINIREVNLEDYAVNLEDRTLETPKRIALDSIKVDLKNVSNEKDSQAEITAALKINQTGTAQIDGEFGINPVSTDIALKIDRDSVKPMQPYVDAVAPVELASGTISLDGRVKYRALHGDGPKVRLEGGVRIEDLKTVDRRNSEVLYSLKSFTVQGLALDVGPNALSISEVSLSEPDFKIAISPDGEINVVTILTVKDETSKQGETGKKVESLLDKVVKYITFHLQGPMPISIDTVRVENGVLDFSDLFIKPKFAADAKNLRGRIEGLSSEASTRANVLLEGEVNKYAPVRISGQINPLTAEKYADLTMSFENFDLTSTSPYAGKFAGYTVEKGKLLLELNYKVSGNKFSGENRIVVKQLTLGERVDSPDATEMPVSLAVALLKDPNGNIELNVPVKGDVDDPHFDFGKVIATTLKNTLTKLVSSPFTILGSLAGGGGEDLNNIEFEFGSAKLSPQQVEKLDKLAVALSDRPALLLKIEGTADKKKDGEALTEAELLAELKREKRYQLRRAGEPVPADAEKISLSSSDYRRYIKKLYLKRFKEEPENLLSAESNTSGNNPSSIDSDAVVAAAKQRLMESMAVDETELKALAQKRATQIRDYLIQQDKVFEERVIAVLARVDNVANEDTVPTNLILAGS
jgi:outer membrane protein OmpA-like peptidoglycan-associated protein